MSIKSNGHSATEKKEVLPKCGIVMPISSIDGLGAEHWAEVLGILKDVILSSNFEPNLVSDADDIGIIQKRIIQNLYNNEIIVCDVSAKNPNVMFELGIRLAFDKPTIIIKDDKTDYTFDTSIIEHLMYPRDLRFNKIISFKENLKKKLEATYKKSKDDPKYSTFLKNFGEYKVAHLEEKEVSSDKFIMSALEELKNEIYQIRRQTFPKEDGSTVKISALDKIRTQYQKKPLESYVSDFTKVFIDVKKLNSSEAINQNKQLYSEYEEFLKTNLRIREVKFTEKELTDAIEFELLPF